MPHKDDTGASAAVQENGSKDVTTSMYFLQPQPLYETEKPYSLRFVPPEGFPRSNIALQKHENVRIADIRPTVDQLSFEENGFMILPLETQLSYDEFDDEARLIEVYLREVADALRDALGAKHVHIFEHTLRKRHEIFPISTGKPYKYNQPTSMAHIDTTVEWARDMVHKLNGDRAHEILAHRIQCVNVWKPLKGPVQDWPLALCDPRTVDESDLEAADLVYHDYVVENRQIYHQDKLKWYYLSDQQPNEAWVFRQSDSKPGAGVGVPHSSFPNPLAGEDAPPRESVEVRALVYYGGDF